MFSPSRCPAFENSDSGIFEGKTAAEDGIATEMLSASNDENFTTLAEIFRLRALNHATETEDPAWEEHVVNLILKKVAPKMPSDLRPIAILPVLLKVYCAVRLLLVERSFDKLSEWQFAFRPRRQCHKITFMF